jgi:AI-2 transport protein TqsA
MDQTPAPAAPDSSLPSPLVAAALAPQNTLVTGSLLVIATILLSTALSYTRSMMIPFVFALFLSYFVAPWVGFFKRRLNFPHWLAVMLSMLLFMGILGLFALVLRGAIIRLVDGFYLYEERLGELGQMGVDFLGRFELRLDKATILARIRDLSVFPYLQSAAGTAMAFVMDFLLVMVFLIFLVSGKAVGEKKKGLGGEIDDKVRNYILTKILSNLLTALCVWIIYFSFNLDLSLMFATLCFLLCFIPTLGSIVATLLPLPIALVQYDAAWPIWGVLLFPALVQVLIGNILEPKLLGRGLDLHPITILLSLMFWGLIWGVAGMFLAVPIMAVLKIILDKHPLTHHFSEVLAGRSPI